VETQHKQLLKILCDTEDVAGYTPASVGQSDEWTSIVHTAEENEASFCKALTRKPLFTDLYGTYTVTLGELKAVLTMSTAARQTKVPKSTGQQSTQEDGFKEVRRCKRHSTDETAQTLKN
jgi:hypothetical protein